jgi:hypothetical protein
VNGKPVLASRLDPHALVPGDGVTDTRLRAGGRDNDRLTERLRGRDQRLQPGRVDAIVVCN